MRDRANIEHCVLGHNTLLSGVGQAQQSVIVGVHAKTPLRIRAPAGRLGIAWQEPLILTGLRWPATLSNKYMTIGCECHEFAVWERATPDDIVEKRGTNEARYNLAFWEEYRDALIMLCRGRERSGIPPSPPGTGEHTDWRGIPVHPAVTWAAQRATQLRAEMLPSLVVLDGSAESGADFWGRLRQTKQHPTP